MIECDIYILILSCLVCFMLYKCQYCSVICVLPATSQPGLGGSNSIQDLKRDHLQESICSSYTVWYRDIQLEIDISHTIMIRNRVYYRHHPSLTACAYSIGNNVSLCVCWVVLGMGGGGYN